MPTPPGRRSRAASAVVGRSAGAGGLELVLGRAGVGHVDLGDGDLRVARALLRVVQDGRRGILERGVHPLEEGGRLVLGVHDLASQYLTAPRVGFAPTDRRRFALPEFAGGLAGGGSAGVATVEDDAGPRVELAWLTAARVYTAAVAGLLAIGAGLRVYNVDRLSLQGNYEINVEVIDESMAVVLEEIFLTDESNSLELTLGEWEARDLHRKFTEFVLAPLRPLL